MSSGQEPKARGCELPIFSSFAEQRTGHVAQPGAQTLSDTAGAKDWVGNARVSPTWTVIKTQRFLCPGSLLGGTGSSGYSYVTLP